MRIWSIHPKYLDTKGLVALWRETLLAKNVLAGNTIGYKNHPQLNRFKQQTNPLDSINQYLAEVFHESQRRSFKFDKSKINWNYKSQIIDVTSGQIDYEFIHLLNKVKIRDVNRYNIQKEIKQIETHPIFKIIDGKIEDWEILNTI